MSEDILQRLQQAHRQIAGLEETASPGPWSTGWSGDPEAEGKDQAGPLSIVSPNNGGVAKCEPVPTGHASHWDQVEANASFISACRPGPPDYLSRLLADAHAEIERLREAVDELETPLDCGHPRQCLSEHARDDLYPHPHCQWCVEVKETREGKR